MQLVCSLAVIICSVQKMQLVHCKIQVIEHKESKDSTQKMQGLLNIQLNCSDALHYLSDSKKCTETTVG